MKVLAIGNSFSNNANKYFFDIAKAAGTDIKSVSLFIGGCPLSRHFRNMHSGERVYTYNLCGHDSGFYISLDEALLSDDWDIVTLQQASPVSVDWKKYEPYLVPLASHVKELCPAAKLGVHQTWEYRADSARFASLGLSGADEMYSRLCECYLKMRKAVDAEFFIPCGDVFHRAVASGLDVHAPDGHHAGDLGCYLLGLTWTAALTGKRAEGNSFRSVGKDIGEEQILLSQKIVDETVFA